MISLRTIPSAQSVIYGIGDGREKHLPGIIYVNLRIRRELVPRMIRAGGLDV